MVILLCRNCRLVTQSRSEDSPLQKIKFCSTSTDIYLVIDPFQKWLLINSFVSIKIKLAFELIIQNNFNTQTSLVRLI